VPRGDLIEALGYRCIARAAANDLPRAIEDCNAGLKLSPYDGKSLRGRALAYLKMQALDLAIADYEQALRSEPKKAELLYGRGLARQAKGDTLGAEKDIEAAKEISPSIAALFKRYGVP
jgi:tetratricopeptide (TPR) repeat protein